VYMDIKILLGNTKNNNKLLEYNPINDIL